MWTARPTGSARLLLPQVGKYVAMALIVMMACTTPFCLSADMTTLLLKRPDGKFKVNSRIIFNGEIVKGDYDKFVAQVLTYKQMHSDVPLAAPLDRVLEAPPILTFGKSSGGDLAEAMKIGRLIRRLGIFTEINHSCVSACSYLFVSGVNRGGLNSESSVGLHRPYFPKSSIAGLSPEDVSAKFKDLLAQARSFLKEMDVPQSLIEESFLVGSTDVKFMSVHDFVARIGEYTPGFGEFVRATCEWVSHRDRELYYGELLFGIDLTPAQIYARDTLERKLQALYECEERAYDEIRREVVAELRSQMTTERARELARYSVNEPPPLSP